MCIIKVLTNGQCFFIEGKQYLKKIFGIATIARRRYDKTERRLDLMKPFIRVNQYQYIKQQVGTIVNSNSTSIDQNVNNAIAEMVWDNVIALFDTLDEEQITLFQALYTIRHKEEAALFLSKLKDLVIPFPKLSEQQIKRLFPKIKKLQIPDINVMDLQEITYLRWFDRGLNRTFMVAPLREKLIGIQGSLDTHTIKGICSICKGIEEVCLFTASKKGKIQGMYATKGNYICKDELKCNAHLTDVTQLTTFIERLQ